MAIPAGSVFEVRTTGSDLNGGGFVPGGSGTDYSQQDAAQLSVTDADAAGTTNLHSATGGFTSQMVNNLVQISSGSLTAGVYHIAAFVDGNNVTLDRAPGTGSGSTAKVGGALASPGKAGGAVVTGNQVWIKSGTYSVTSTTGNISGGRVNPPNGGTKPTKMSRWVGYQTTRGDNGTRPIIRAGVNMGNAPLLRVGAEFTSFENLEADGNLASFSGARGIEVGAGQSNIVNCIARSCDSRGLNITASGVLVERCQITACTTQAAVTATANAVLCIGCEIWANTAGGVQAQSGMAFIRCLIYGNTGASSDGVVIDDVNNLSTFNRCVFYGNGRHGLNVNLSSSGIMVEVVDCIFYGNGGYGIAVPGNVQCLVVRNSAFGSNTSGAYDSTKLVADYVSGIVTLTGDPFTNAGSADFSLNNTAGAGAACRGAGAGAFPRGLTTGYPDIGAAQHQEVASGGLLTGSGMTGGMRG